MHFVVAELIIDPTWVAYGYDANVEVSLCFHWGVAWKLKWLMILRSAACYNAVWMSYNAWGPNQLPEREREREIVLVAISFILFQDTFWKLSLLESFVEFCLLFVLLFVLQFQFSFIYPDDAVSQLHHFFPTEVY